MDSTRGYLVSLFTIFVLLYRPSYQTELPGIFQNEVCKNETLRTFLEPFCSCKDQLHISDVESLCRNYAELGRCVDKNVPVASRQTSYIPLVFSSLKLNRSMEYLCRVYPDLTASLDACPVFTETSDFEEQFISAITSKDNTSEQHYCRATEELRHCYWKITSKDCTARARHFYSKLSEAFISNECTKHTGVSISDKCDVFAKTFNAEESMTCVDVARTNTDCFTYEMTNSHHPRDKFIFFDFDTDRYYRTERRRCEVKQDIKKKCLYAHKKNISKCKGFYMTFIGERSTLVNQGHELSLSEVCSVYSNVTSCMGDDVQPECQTTIDYVNLIFCANMPSTCHCPVEMPPALPASVSKATTTTHYNVRLVFAIVLLVYIQYLF